MNWLVVLVFALAAFFFLESDMVFLALLCVVGLVLALYYYSDAGGAGSGHGHGARGGHGVAAGHGGRADGEGPMVIKVGGKHHKPPELYRVRVYPTWENRSAWEEFGKNYLGPVLNVFGGTAYRAVTGKHSEKGKDMPIEEAFRGR